MKTFHLLFFLFLITSLTTLSAQNEDLTANYLFDGENTSFVWGRQIDANKIAIGLSDEGVYELRNGNEIWLTQHPILKDELIAKVLDDEQSENKIIALGDFSMPDAIYDIFAVYSPDNKEIMDKDSEIIAHIDSYAKKISSVKGQTYLQYGEPIANDYLLTFFFLFKYLPETQENKLFKK